MAGSYSHAANALLKTVDLDMQSIKEWAILDSGATSHFLVTAAPTASVQVATNPLTVTIPDGSKVKSTHTCTLAIPELPPKAIIGGATVESIPYSRSLQLPRSIWSCRHLKKSQRNPPRARAGHRLPNVSRASPDLLPNLHHHRCNSTIASNCSPGVAKSASLY